MAAHPGWIRIPAQFVPHGDDRSGERLAFDLDDGLGEMLARAAAAGAIPGPAIEGRAVRDTSERAGNELLIDVAERRETATAPQPPAVLRRDLTKPVPFVDDNGAPVLGADGHPMMRPEGFDPHFFVEQGRLDSTP